MSPKYQYCFLCQSSGAGYYQVLVLPQKSQYCVFEISMTSVNLRQILNLDLTKAFFTHIISSLFPLSFLLLFLCLPHTTPLTYFSHPPTLLPLCVSLGCWAVLPSTLNLLPLFLHLSFPSFHPLPLLLIISNLLPRLSRRLLSMLFQTWAHNASPSLSRCLSPSVSPIDDISAGDCYPGNWSSAPQGCH